MKLAFCDDRPNTVSFIADYIRDYFISVSIPLEIKIYDDAMELVRDTANGIIYDMYLLDYDMPVLSGEELIKELKRYAPLSIYGYISFFDNIGSSACRAGCDLYLYKSDKKDKIFPEMERVYEKFLRLHSNFVFYLPSGDVRQVPVIDIQYIHTAYRRVYVATLTEDFRVVGRSLDEYTNCAEFYNFVRVSRSYFVNYDNVVNSFFKSGHWLIMANNARIKADSVYFRRF